MSYRVAPVFLIRLAGVPFDAIERLATGETSRAARDLLGGDNNSGAEAQANFASSLERELEISRDLLLRSARTILSRYLIFGGGGMRERTAALLESSAADQGRQPRRNARARERERHLLLYLQRVAAKNDTFSEFGPSGWARIDNATRGLRMDIQPGIAAREAFLERWTAHAIAAAINADPDNFAKLQVPALEPHAFEVLRDDVGKWPPSPTRDKWLPILNALSELPLKFIATTETKDRQSILDEARTRLRSLGFERKSGDRFLYAAVNPIGEECFRETNFVIGEKLINEVAVDAEPWIDLWRDSYAFIASRVAAGLRGVMEKAAARRGVVPLPAFLQACEAAKLPLTGPGLVTLAVIAFQEVKAAFRKRLEPHVDLTDYELTTEDCHVVRNSFEYPKFDEYTYPSADLQISAASAEAVARGEYQWVLSELHPPAALLHHCMYWSCPDKPALGRALASTTCGHPNMHFGFFAADFTAHTAVRVFDAIPQLTNFVAPQRPHPSWKKISPSDAEVYVDETSGDVCVRKSGSKEHLGSFARAWIIPLGFHPFQFGMAPHVPRLRCGKVIVQRRAWTITHEELGAGRYTGVSPDLVLGVERLRAQKGWPRFVYIRPTEQALRRSGAEGRDKDTKPVFVDLESYLFLEIFHRWLTKSGELEVTEMLPDPDHLLWKEPDGRRTFELRTLIVPRS